MSKFAGYTNDQRFRVAWASGASESMTLSEAQAWAGSPDGAWIEEWNGYEWVRM